MHQLVRALAATVLAAACAASWAAAEPAPQGRLPDWAVPQSYRLAFKIDPAQADFSGSTTIKLKLTRASDHLWLDGNELKVSRVTITDAAGKPHAGSYVPVDPQAGVARVDFGGTLPPQELTLAFEYRAPLNAHLEGLYKVSAGGKAYAMTQMEPISARYAFPGFDEPGFKTPFDISLTIPAADTAMANTRQVGEAPAGKGWKTLTFAQTLPLPTYLVAFGVGPWDIAKAPDIAPDAYRSEPLPLRGIAVSGEAHRMTHVLGETSRIIRALEDYYGFGYPFDKLDIFAAPDFSAGAMENPGLVTFRDWLLLLDPDSPAEYVRGSFETTAHELAHQWTGDTVTLSWWNELWLNESFATWMEQKITAQLHPEYRADLDRILGAHAAMENDSLASARKVRQPITGNGDIETAFDGITYEKGAAVLGMFEAYVGEDVFQRGMRAYIQQHKFGNVDADDLVGAIAAAAGKDERFKQDFKSFLDQSGVPYVRTRLAQQKDGAIVLQLSQRRYLPLGSDAEAGRVWGVPVCVRYGTADGSKVGCQLLDQEQGSMVLAGASQPLWVMPNANGSGYYHFGMAKADLVGLSKRVGLLADTEQLAYADAVKAGFHDGDLDAGDVLLALKPLAASKTEEVATEPLAQLKWIYQHEAVTQAQRDHLAGWAKAAYLPRLQQLGYRRKDGEPESDSLLRAELADALALDFRVPEVCDALLEQGDAVLRLKDGRLDLAAADRDLLDTALAVAVRRRGKSAVDVLMAQLPKISDAAGRNAILSALSRAEEPALAERVRDFALSPQVKVGEMNQLTRGSHDTEARRDALWQWSVANFDRIVARMGRASGGFLPRLMAGSGCSQAEADRLTAFFTPRLQQLTGAERGLAQTREATLLCAALKAKQDPAAMMR